MEICPYKTHFNETNLRQQTFSFKFFITQWGKPEEYGYNRSVFYHNKTHQHSIITLRMYCKWAPWQYKSQATRAIVQQLFLEQEQRKHQSSASLALWDRNPPVTDGFPAQLKGDYTDLLQFNFVSLQIFAHLSCHVQHFATMTCPKFDCEQGPILRFHRLFHKLFQNTSLRLCGQVVTIF